MLLSLRVGTRIVSLLTEEEDEEIGVLVGWGSRRDSEKILDVENKLIVHRN
jgi:hypothetical protein